MTGTAYQLMKNDEPIAIGSMSHCLDVFYWEIYHGYNHLAYNIVPFSQDEEVYRKAKAWDNYMVDTYLYDKIYSDGDHKEAYDFYMKTDVKSYIDCLNKELADTGHFINSVEEYKQILNEIEGKQND